MTNIEQRKINLLDQIEKEAACTSGPNINVIRAMKTLVESNFDLIQSNNEVKTAIELFNKATIKSQSQVTQMTWLTIGLALIQVVVAIIK